MMHKICFVKSVLPLVVFLLFLTIMPSYIYGSDDAMEEISLGDLLNIEIEVASSKAENIFNTPSTVTVVDRDMIERYNFLTVAEAVNTVAGINILHTHYINNIPTSRGLLQYYYANKILLMINGVSTWMTVQGYGTLNRIDIHDVERIEVLKGPASVLYGTNAYNGAINIVLKDSEDTEISGHAGFGYKNFYSGGARANYKKDDLKLMISGNSYSEKRDEYSFTDNNKYTFNFQEEESSQNINILAEYKEHSLTFNSYNMTEPCIGVFYRYEDGIGTTDEEGMLINYRFDKRFMEKWNLVSNIFYDYNKLEHPLFGLNYDVEGNRLGGDAKMIYDITDNFSLEAGMDYNHNKSDEYIGKDAQGNPVRDVGATDKSVDEFSIFAQANYQYKMISCLLGSRYTDNELYGNNLSSRITTVLNMNENNSIKFIVGQSFRSPSFMEIYMSGKNIKPNEDLQPETNTSYEIAYLTRWNNLFLQTTAYYAKYDDLIKRVPIPGTEDRRYENAYSMDGYGFEVELKYQNPKIINAFLNYSLVHEGDNEDDVKNDPFYNYKFFPKHSINFGVNKTFGMFFISANGNYISETEGPYEDIDSQFLMDTHIGFHQTLNKDVKLRHTISFKNITDSDTLMPEYIRQMGTVNEIPASGYGRRFIYTMAFSF